MSHHRATSPRKCSVQYQHTGISLVSQVPDGGGRSSGSGQDHRKRIALRDTEHDHP